MAILASERQITFQEIREAAELTPVEWSGWDEDDEWGERLYVVGTTYADRRLWICLFPVNEPDGVYRIGTARGAIPGRPAHRA